MRKWLFLLAAVLLLGISVYAFVGTGKTELSVRTTKEENRVRKDFVDSDGNVTLSPEKKYATLIRTYEGKNPVLDEYLDEEGKPAVLPDGYSQVRREYEADGEHSVITFLDASGNVTETVYGYTSIHRVNSENERVDMYYRGDTQVTGKEGAYGVRRVYSDGVLIRLEYLNRDGGLMNGEKGYARIEISHSASGERRLLYDENGEAVTGRRQQYGVEYEDGEKYYLDEKGEKTFRPDLFLYSHPVVVMLIGAVLMIAAAFLKGKLRFLFLGAYLLFVFYMTFGTRNSGDDRICMDIFWSYRQFFSDPEARRQILCNIWLFVPLGAFFSRWKKPWWLLPVLLSVMIEAVQYLTGRGFCDIDDVVSNSLGTLVGLLVGLALQKFNGHEGPE